MNPRRTTEGRMVPDFGWYYRFPSLQMPNCSWCGNRTELHGGMTICGSCDAPPLIPAWS